MPEDPRGRGPVRSPRLADRLQLVRRGPCLEAARPAGALLERDVADGPRVRPPEGGEEVDLGRPRPDPRQGHERGPRRLVVQRRHDVEIERSVLDRGREHAHIARLLAAEAVGAELGVGRSEDSGGREAPESRLEAVVRGARRGQRDLLLEDQQDERLEARLARPELRQPVELHDRREIGIGRAELGGGRRERRLVQHRANATRRRWVMVYAMTREPSQTPPSGLLALGLLLLPR
jgi:hypothetical protein